MSKPRLPVELSDLLDPTDDLDLVALYVQSASTPVRTVVLVHDIEQITALAPDAMVVLATEVARGSWIVSAALRYAWERRAAGVIAPRTAVAPSAVRLARRFKMSLFTSASDSTHVALEMAGRVGYARARQSVTLGRVAGQTERATHIDDVLHVASRHLQGAAVSLVVADVIVASTAGLGAASLTPDAVRVIVPSVSDDTARATLVANVTRDMRERAVEVLTLCRGQLRALRAEARVESLRRSLPLLAAATLSGSDARLPTAAEGAVGTAVPALGTESMVTVCIASDRVHDHGAVVHDVWITEFPDIPLATLTDGWLAFFPVASAVEEGRDSAAMERRLHSLAARLPLVDVRVGMSDAMPGAEAVSRGVRQAWLAARVAGDGETRVTAHPDVPRRLGSRLLPSTFAIELLSELYPRLMADTHRDDLIAVLDTYASTHGSATRTADVLRVHRNTVRQRVDRLRELGVPIDDPARALGVHLLAASARATPPASVTAPGSET